MEKIIILNKMRIAALCVAVVVLSFFSPQLRGEATSVAPRLTPITESKAWAKRLQKLWPNKGWTISARGKDITIERHKPVRFILNSYNETTHHDNPSTFSQRQYRLVLRFAPRMSQDQYDKLLAQNWANADKKLQLRRGFFIGNEFRKRMSKRETKEQEKERVRQYSTAVKNLVFHKLPDLYSPSCSIIVYRAERINEDVSSNGAEDDKVADECMQAYDSVTKPYGLYGASSNLDRNSIWSRTD